MKYRGVATIDATEAVASVKSQEHRLKPA